MNPYEDFCSDFDFEIDRVIAEINSRKARKIVIQLPEGLLRCYTYIVNSLMEKLSGQIEDIFISGNPGFGGCLVDELTYRDVNADLLIHFGHLEYPGFKTSVNAVFVPVEFKGRRNEHLREIVNVLSKICEKSEKLCVAASYQHLLLARDICNKVGCCIRVGAILGCMPLIDANCSSYMVIAGGEFHCLAQLLHVLSSGINAAVLCYDPFRGIVVDSSDKARRMLAVRMWKVEEARYARRWLIVDGFYGQSRNHIVKILSREIVKRGGTAHIVKALYIDEKLLRNLGVDNYDVAVISSCPRIAVDDFAHFEKPVLTVREALYVLGLVESYGLL